jgi:hypothetical protein
MENGREIWKGVYFMKTRNMAGMSKKILRIKLTIFFFVFCNISCHKEKEKYDFVSIGNTSIIMKNSKIDTFLISSQSTYDYFTYLDNHFDTFTTYLSIEPTIRKDSFFNTFFETTKEVKFLEYYYNEKLKVSYDKIISDTMLYNDLLVNFKELLEYMTQYHFNTIDYINNTDQLKGYIETLKFDRRIYYNSNENLTDDYINFLVNRDMIQFKKANDLLLKNIVNKNNILFKCSIGRGDRNDLFIILKIIRSNNNKLILFNKFINPELYNSKYYKYTLNLFPGFPM